MTSREHDKTIQYYLLNEDLAYYFMDNDIGRRLLLHLYETRGSDFFVLAGNVDACRFVSEALLSVGRSEEAAIVLNEMDKFISGERQLNEEYSGPEYSTHETGVNRLRIVGQRFWSDYLGASAWNLLSQTSRTELGDAFSQEELLRREVLNSWSSVVLLLCKCIERELAHTIFLPSLYRTSCLQAVPGA